MPVHAVCLCDPRSNGDELRLDLQLASALIGEQATCGYRMAATVARFSHRRKVVASVCPRVASITCTTPQIWHHVWRSAPTRQPPAPKHPVAALHRLHIRHLFAPHLLLCLLHGPKCRSRRGMAGTTKAKTSGGTGTEACSKLCHLHDFL